MIFLRKLFNYFQPSMPKGIKLPEYKALSNQNHSIDFPDVDKYYISLNQRDGEQAVATVKIGQMVKQGEIIAKPLSKLAAYKHSPVSGIVSDITNITETHPSQQSIMAIEITNDYKQTKTHQFHPIKHALTTNKNILLERIELAGITGMGGAGFPTERKINLNQSVEHLIINGAESEPYITCDDRLMRESAAQIIQGALITAYLISCKNIYFGIEKNKPEAINAMQTALQTIKENQSITTHCEVIELPEKYPMGSRHQIAHFILGQKTNIQQRAYLSGFVCQNVATAYAIDKAINEGAPVVERLLTVSGNAIIRPGVYRVKIGTPIQSIINMVQNSHSSSEVFVGGTMMGFSLPMQTSAVIKKETIGLLLINSEYNNTKQEIIKPNFEEQACIRCGLCAQVCPQNLLPQELQFYGKSHQLEKSKQLRIMDCIECGLCSYVCPSHIPLVPIFQHTKGEIKKEKLQQTKNYEAKIRFESRNFRLENEKKQKQKQLELRRAKMQAQANSVKELKPQHASNTDKKDLIAKAIAKAKKNKEKKI